jgi:hypothetical protein
LVEGEDDKHGYGNGGDEGESDEAVEDDQVGTAGGGGFVVVAILEDGWLVLRATHT